MTTNAIDEAMSRRIAARMPVLGVVSVGTALVWIGLLALTGKSSLGASIGLLVSQIAVFATAALLVRGADQARRSVPVAVFACVLTMYSWTVFFAMAGGSTVLLVFVAFAILIYAPLIIPWGWRAEAALFVGAAAAVPVAIPYFQVQLLGGERFVVFTAGGLLALAAAKWFTDVFRDEIGRQMAEETMRRELAASRDAYRDLAESAPDLIWTADPDGRLTYVNAAFIRAFGSAASMIGSRIGDLRTPHPDNPDFESVTSTHGPGGDDSPVVVQLQSLAGPRWIEALVTAIEEPDGRIAGWRGIGRDITARRRIEEALRESEVRYRALVESQRDLVLRYDEDGRLSFVNDAVCTRLGIERATALDVSVWRFVHPDDADVLRACMQRTRVPPYRGQVEIRVQMPEGWRWIEWEASAIRDEHGTVREIQSAGRDVTDRRATDEALRASLAELQHGKARLRSLAQQQALVREQERKRLSFDLHDDVCQELVGVGMLIESVRQRLHAAPDPVRTDLARSVEYLGKLVEHLRALAGELRPMMLHELGLERILRDLTAAMSCAETSVTVEFPTAIPRLEEDAELAVYRIAQEALLNAVRHAGAASVTLTMTTSHGRVRLRVHDDGRGFDIRGRCQGIGLVSMEERALALGGHLEVRSEPGAGTTVSLDFPWTARAAAAQR